MYNFIKDDSSWHWHHFDHKNGWIRNYFNLQPVMQNIISSPIYPEQTTQKTSKLREADSLPENVSPHVTPFSSWSTDYEDYTPNTFDFFQTTRSANIFSSLKFDTNTVVFFAIKPHFFAGALFCTIFDILWCKKGPCKKTGLYWKKWITDGFQL